MSELLTKMFFGGFVRLHVLYHAVKEPIFGVEMMEELAATATTSARHALPDAASVGGGGLPDLTPRWWPASTEILPSHARGGQGAWRRPRRSSASWSRKSSTTTRPPRQSGSTTRWGIGAMRKVPS